MGVCGKPVCKQLLKGGTKTCEPTSSCSGFKPKKKTTKDGEMTTQTQKRCKNEQFCDSTNKCQMDIEDSCGTNNDCMNLNIDKRFCLNSGLTKHCVPKRPCKVHCTDLQICDKRENTCKDPSMKSFRISVFPKISIFDSPHYLLTFPAFCVSNEDCSDVSGRPFCRQYAKGSRKTCQVKNNFLHNFLQFSRQPISV